MPTNLNTSKPRLCERRLVLGGLFALLGLGWVGAQASDRPVRVGPSAEAEGAGAGGFQSRVDDSTCIQCHRFEPVLTHPIKVRASMRTPEALPLQNGMVGCFTCHDADANHAQTRARVGVRWEGDSASGCTQCHQAGASGSRISHALAVGKAHFVGERTGKLLAKPAGLDAQSASCMGCHDGAVAMVAGSHALGRMALDGSTDHPVGVLMKSSGRTLGSDFKLADPQSLDHRIRLVDGKVSCGSCHSAYSKERAQLVMSNQGSSLCLHCHKQ